MSDKKTKGRVVQKHAIESDWEKAINFIPLQGEIIVYDSDDTYDYERIKIGDGVRNVNVLPFVDDVIKGLVNLDSNILNMMLEEVLV